jgi:hypothetical protein
MYARLLLSVLLLLLRLASRVVFKLKSDGKQVQRSGRSDAHQLENLAATPITGFLVDTVA